MTANQIAYQRHLEDKRHALVTEAQGERDVATRERSQTETARANRANEALTLRQRLLDEEKLAETKKQNTIGNLLTGVQRAIDLLEHTRKSKDTESLIALRSAQEQLENAKTTTEREKAKLTAQQVLTEVEKTNLTAAQKQQARTGIETADWERQKSAADALYKWRTLPSEFSGWMQSEIGGVGNALQPWANIAFGRSGAVQGVQDARDLFGPTKIY